MINTLNALKAFIISLVTSCSYTLYSSTASFQQQLAREGQEVGKIEALMHYSSFTDVWSRMFTYGLPLFLISLCSCLILLFWLQKPE
jgi:hypothetical protein